MQQQLVRRERKAGNQRKRGESIRSTPVPCFFWYFHVFGSLVGNLRCGGVFAGGFNLIRDSVQCVCVWHLSGGFNDEK